MSKWLSESLHNGNSVPMQASTLQAVDNMSHRNITEIIDKLEDQVWTSITIHASTGSNFTKSDLTSIFNKYRSYGGKFI
jgi:hypothetical protein